MDTDKQLDLESWNFELEDTLEIVSNLGVIITSFINEETKVQMGWVTYPMS